jgi:hypothetical protein
LQRELKCAPATASQLVKVFRGNGHAK